MRISDWSSDVCSSDLLEDFSLSVKEGEFFCLLGPSGCGKTSILNLLAGFTTPNGGTIELSGTRVCHADADRGVVFQTDDALFPWQIGRASCRERVCQSV